MVKNFLLISSLILVVAAAAFPQTYAWNQIVPLSSSRGDVEGILGKPVEQTSSSSKFSTKDGEILVFYSNKKCDDGWDVPADTVWGFRVMPLSEIGKSAKQLKLDRKRFNLSIDDAFYAKWTDAEKGLQYYFRDIELELQYITYTPKKSDNNLRCDGYPPYAPEADYYPFDRLGFYKPKLRKKNDIYEIAPRLHSFLMGLGADPQARGYILAYFDNKLPLREYRRRLKKVEEFIFIARETSPERVFIIEGGLKENAVLEFYILPKDVISPAPNPDFPSPQFIKRQK